MCSSATWRGRTPIIRSPCPAPGNPEGAVRAVDPETPEGREVVDYVEHGCVSQGLNGRVDTSSYVDLAGHHGARILPAEEGV